MSFDWRDEWERHAEKESKAQQSRSVSELLEDVREGWFDGYYKIWYTIARKATAHQALPTLLEAARKMLKQTDFMDDLQIIHCLTAICKLLQIPDKEAKEYIYAQDKLQAVQMLSEIFEKLPQNK
ncbi:MAG: hypothetical protein NZ551_08565 [Microscillaceae bacterium]|nr:hypothetical protein [Microscillaceae bacterium]MDW8461252.1 hypothetical protein [Cytophagales bacterium]